MASGYVFDIKRYAVHDGPGIRTTIFLQGCPLRCWWCHNPEGIRSHPGAMSNAIKAVQEISVTDLMKEIIKDRIFYDESGGGVTFSGGEPLVQHEFLRDILLACKQEEIHTALDTTGYATPAILFSVQDLVDLFLYDLKPIDEALHETFTGVPNSLIHSNLKVLVDHKKQVAIRIPLIPGITDTEENLVQLTRFLHSLKRITIIHLLPYHRIADEKYRRLKIENQMKEICPPSPEKIEAVQQYLEEQGYSVKIGG